MLYKILLQLISTQVLPWLSAKWEMVGKEGILSVDTIDELTNFISENNKDLPHIETICDIIKIAFSESLLIKGSIEGIAPPYDLTKSYETVKDTLEDSITQIEWETILGGFMKAFVQTTEVRVLH